MPFPRRLLNDYENIALDLHPHWLYFAESVSTLAGTMIAVMFGLSKIPSGFFHNVFSYVGLAAIIATVNAELQAKVLNGAQPISSSRPIALFIDRVWSLETESRFPSNV